MKKYNLLLCFLFSAYVHMVGQPNCEAYKYYGDTLKYQACKAAEGRKGHYQFSKTYQESLDKAISIDPSFAYAYKAKSTAYLKSGDFITWKELMDKAVNNNPIENLDYRGWCRFQFFRDYKGAIEDIELLDSLVEYDIGYCQNGYYHLNVAKGLCYKALGQNEKAIEIIENQLNHDDHHSGLFDYLHLGVLYLELGDFHNAIEKLLIQADENDLAENRFYLALVYKSLNQYDDYVSNLKLAREKYISNNKMFDPYSAQVDKIYLSDIEDEIQIAKEKGYDF